MKALKLLTVSYLALPTTAFSLSSLVSKSHQAALAGVTAAQKAMSEANVSAAMAAAAKRTRDFAAESVPEATLLAYKACKTNPGTTVACGTAGVGLLMVAAPAILAAPSLAAAGFGAHGVVLGAFPKFPFSQISPQACASSMLFVFKLTLAC